MKSVICGKHTNKERQGRKKEKQREAMRENTEEEMFC